MAETTIAQQTMRGSLRVLPWVLTVIMGGASAWSYNRAREAQRTSSDKQNQLDSLAGELEIAASDREEAIRLQHISEELRRNTSLSKEEAERQYAEAVAQGEEAKAQTRLARQEARAKEGALREAEQAGAAEREQRRIADARADSIKKEKQLSDRANRQLNASKIAQNSMNVKGAPQRRGLMAVYAVRAIEETGGDLNKDELVRATQGALEELERGLPIGIDNLGAAPWCMRLKDGALITLGNDGRLLEVDPGTWRSRTIASASAFTGASGGRAFLSVDGSAILGTNAEHAVALCSAKDGSVVAKAGHTAHTEDVTAMASFRGNDALVSADRNGQFVVWSVDGTALREVSKPKAVGGARAALLEPKSDRVVVVHGTDHISLISKDGSLSTVALDGGDRAWCVAAHTGSEVVIGTNNGRVLALNPGTGKLRELFGGNGQRVETLVSDGDRLAFVDGAHYLTVVSPGSSSTPFRMSISGTPNVLTFGSSDLLYLAYSDRNIRRTYTSTKAMANAVCKLVGRGFTLEEWRDLGGEGAPVATCTRP